MTKIFKSAALAVLLALSASIAHAGSEVQQPLEPGEQWMGVYFGGGKVGWATSRSEPSVDGWRIRDEMSVTLNVMGITQSVNTRTDSETGRDYKMRSFAFSMDAGIASMKITGKVDKNTLRLDIDSAGSVSKREIPLAETPYLASGIELYLMERKLEPGMKFSLPFFDPATLSREPIDIEVEGREEMKLGGELLPVYRIKETYAGVVTTAWMSREQGAIKGEGPMGFTFLKETKGQATSMPEGGYAPEDIIAMASVPASGKKVAEPRKVVYMKARLSGIETEGLALNGDGQQYSDSDGVVTVTAADLSVVPAVMPHAPPEFLKPEPFVQSDDPGIAAKAAEVAGGEQNPLKAAMKIADWVNRNVRKKPSAGIPSAVEVLGNLSGDCNEHTVLFTALARAIGIPARMDAGVVLMDGRFYYHAWPEIYYNRWIAVDPTFGQFPADATHIKLAEGPLDKQVGMLKVMGKMNIEVLEWR